MSPDEVMKLPIKTFWLFSENIERITAQKDIRSISVAMAPQISGEHVGNLQQKLIVEMGRVVTLKGGDKQVQASYRDDKRDEAGFAELRMLAARM